MLAHINLILKGKKMYTVNYKNTYLHCYIDKPDTHFIFNRVQYKAKSLHSAKIKVSKLIK